MTQTPTDRWLTAVSDILPPLAGAAGTAERLLLLLHYGINWDSWIGARRTTYWDQILPDRIIIATYRAGTLPAAWTYLATELESRPNNPDERRELAQLLTADPIPVLELWRSDTEALILRTRIVADAIRAKKAADPR